MANLNALPEYAIWTIQISRWRLAKRLAIPILDITAKSGVRAFAPNFDYVMAYKRGEMSEEEYTFHYLERMKTSRRVNPQAWEKLKEQKEVALACYCASGVFCHRHLFSGLMKDYLKEQGFETSLMGELLPVA